MKNTKIIGTIGPITNNRDIIKKMILAGMNVVRINLSHADHNFSKEVINTVRELNKELKTNVGILMDTKGSDLRLNTFKETKINVNKGDQIIITSKEPLEDDSKLLINYNNISNDVNIGDKILLGDGSIGLNIIDISLDDVICEVINEGIIHDTIGVNIPGVTLNLEFLSPADKKDIVFASEMNVDFIALSYVRNANDVLDVNDMLIQLRDEHMQIIAKIENESAVEDINDIIKVSDGIMVARGDLGVEIPIEKVPGIQKSIVKKCYAANKICIVATQMLASMKDNPRPTRAEVSDVANAVVDGVDAVMLSDETAAGEYPVETVDMMSRIIKDIEATLDYQKILVDRTPNVEEDITNVIAHNVVDSANRLKAKAIVVSTISGHTARMVSNYRPCCPIIVTTPNEQTARELSLNWGVKTVLVNMFDSTDQIVNNAIETYKELIPVRDSKIIITGAFPMGHNQATNFMKIADIS